MYLIMSHHHQLKTFHHCQLSLEVKLFIMAIETLTSLVQVYDSNPTVSLLTSHMGLWVSDSHLCVTFSSCYLLYMEKQEGCGEGPQLGCLTTFPRAPCSQHHNSRLLSYLYTVLRMLLFSFIFNHWAFAHSTSSAWKTLWHLVRLVPPSFRTCPEGFSASASTALCACFYKGTNHSDLNICFLNHFPHLTLSDLLPYFQHLT